MPETEHTKRIKLTQGKFAIVDAEDYEKLSRYKWYAQRHGERWYAVRNEYLGGGEYRQIYMHREILNPPAGMEIDHINHDSLDNRRVNIRICTNSQNMMNGNSHKGSSSKFKGVFWHKLRRKWQAQIRKNYKAIYLGYYDSEVEAARTYDRAAKDLFGEFAKPNFAGE